MAETTSTLVERNSGPVTRIIGSSRSAQNMACGVKQPHLGEWIMNVGEAAESMFDHNISRSTWSRSTSASPATREMFVLRMHSPMAFHPEVK